MQAMKIKFEWENIFIEEEKNCTSRAKVIGGWLVHHAMSSGDEISTAMEFVYDPSHSWVNEINKYIPIKNILIDYLPLMDRTKHILKAENILTLEDLILRTEFSLLILPNFGKKSLNDTKEILEKLGLSLGMGN
jgi:DNA-directed RNA polymerase alpha subunit